MINRGMDRASVQGEKLGFLILLETVLAGLWAASPSSAQPFEDEQHSLQPAEPPIHLSRLELGEEGVISLHFSDPPPPEVTIEGCDTFTDWSSLQILTREEQRIQVKDPKAASDRSRLCRAKLMARVQK
jgi:hypothetical protein